MVWYAFEDMEGREIHMKKISSMAIINIADAVAPDAELKFIGVCPSEKNLRTND